MTDFDKRKSKYQPTNTKTARKAPQASGITEYMLNSFCRYALSMNDNIRKHGLTMLNSLIIRINPEDFIKNQNCAIKLRFLKAILENRMNGLNDREMILSNINLTMDITNLEKDQSLTRELSNDEVISIEGNISMLLTNNEVDEHINVLLDAITKYQNADFREKNQTIDYLKSRISDIQTVFRRNEINKDSSDTLFRLSQLETTVPDIHKYVTSPSYKLVTGMQGFNAMLGGGFQKERVYSFFGASGSGKTTTLENIMYQLWKYNQDFITQDKSKKPCIILLTMENLVVETVCSLYHIMTKGKSMEACATAEDAIAQFKACQFEFDPENKRAVELFIKYKPVNSVDTSYMYKIVEDLEDEGFETIAFLQDYMMRIKPSERTKDVYQDLGTVVNDFKTFAISKKIPVITASQLNREAMKIIDEGRNANKLDSIKKLGRANIGESIKIDTNLDGTFIIVPEYDKEGNRYLGIKMTKHRYKLPPTHRLDSIFQPFYPKSVALVEDLFEPKAVYRESLINNDIEEVTSKFGTTEHVSINNPAKRLEALNKSVDMTAGTGLVKTPKKDNSVSMPTETMVERPQTKMEDTKLIEMTPKFSLDNEDSSPFAKNKKKEVIVLVPPPHINKQAH